MIWFFACALPLMALVAVLTLGAWAIYAVLFLVGGQDD